MRIIPETSNRSDWPRLVARAVNAIGKDTIRPAALQDFANDAAAAAGGVEINGFYRTGSIVKVRVS
jgi:hypothetical protein